jgi:hypothetical protein
MANKTRSSKARRQTHAPVPAGAGGLSLSQESTKLFVTPPRHDSIVDLHEDEVSDVTLGSFYVVDNENPGGALRAGAKQGSRVRGWRCGRCGGCFGCIGCWWQTP